MFSPSHRAILAGLFTLLNAAEAFAAKKDFRGLFGSYRREQYVENEGRNTDFGFDIGLSTLLPVSPIVKSVETAGGAPDSLKYSTFFNLEGSLFFTLNYHWEIYGTVGYYSFDTRKENTVFTQTDLPLFHQFEMSLIPIVGGIRYRFSTDDIVPYVGIGAGMARTKRRAFYDYSTTVSGERSENVVVGQIQGGVEFFIASRAGIRLEISAFYMNLKTFEFTQNPFSQQFPSIISQANPWTVRYSSGLFFLF